MKGKSILAYLMILFLAYGEIAFARGEMILVEGRFFEGYISSFQFTVNGEHHYVCTGGSPYCPSSMYISIDPNKDYIFNLYDYEGRPYYYTISDSCRNQVINVKPNTGKTIKIVRNELSIVCN